MPGDHEQFDRICVDLDEHEPLPTVVAAPTSDPDPSEDEEQRTAPLDELILAGLVSPY